MSIFVNLSTPILLLAALLITVLLIFLSRELKKPYIVLIALAIFLVLAVVHSIQIGNISKLENEKMYSELLYCIAMDSIMIFVTFFSYLWIDDIACKFYKKKSLDNSLDWFWKQV